MLYGFGDVPPEEQDPETQEMIDDLLCEYLRFMSREATSVAAGGRISVDDTLFVLRKVSLLV